MSYVATLGVGDVETWSQWVAHWMTPDEVYVLRMKIAGVPAPSRRQDALEFVHAAGTALHDLGWDERAVAVKVDGDTLVVDVVLTVPALTSTLSEWPGVQERKRAAIEAALQKTWPKVAVSTADIGRLTLPDDSIRFWLSQPVLYDHRLAGGAGAPTSAFARPAEYSVVTGSADDGPRSVPFKDSGGSVNPPKAPGTALLWVVAAGAIVWVGLKRLGK